MSFLTFQIFFLYQNIDTFLWAKGETCEGQKRERKLEDPATYLYHLNLRLKSCGQLIQHFVHELRVVEHLSHLHDTHDRRLDEYLTIFLDVFMCRFLFHLQFRLQREVDVDAEFTAVFTGQGNCEKYKSANEFIHCSLTRFTHFLKSLFSSMVESGCSLPSPS